MTGGCLGCSGIQRSHTCGREPSAVSQTATTVLVVTGDPLSSLAGRVRDELAEADRHYLSAAEHAANAGDALREAKAQVKHGEWLPWLKDNVPGLSRRHATNLMKLGKARANGLSLEDMSLRDGLKAIAPHKTNGKHVAHLEESETSNPLETSEPPEPQTALEAAMPEPPETVDAEFTVVEPKAPAEPAPLEPWSALAWHIAEAKRLIEEFLQTAVNTDKRHRLDHTADRLDDVADLLGYSPTMLETAAGLVAQAQLLSDEGEDE